MKGSWAYLLFVFMLLSVLAKGQNTCSLEGFFVLQVNDVLVGCDSDDGVESVRLIDENGNERCDLNVNCGLVLWNVDSACFQGTTFLEVSMKRKRLTVLFPLDKRSESLFTVRIQKGSGGKYYCDVDNLCRGGRISSQMDCESR